jgi:hypothetical protein
MRQKLDEELRKKEKEVLEYWRKELDKTMLKRHQDLGSLQTDLKALLARMDKRLTAI